METQYYIDGESCNKNCLKGRGENYKQHKKLEKNKIIRIWITIIRHGGLGRRFKSHGLIYQMPGRGGLPYERGGDARRLAWGCKFQILVSLL